ncbi:MAG: ABC transporter ATP-binding protein [Chloroflexota bacterium]
MEENSRKTQSDWQIVRRLLTYMQGETTLLLGTLVMLVLFTVGQAFGPTLIGQAIDQYIAAGDLSGLSRTMLTLLAVYLVSWLGFVGQIRFMATLAQRILLKLRSGIFSHLQKLSLNYYFENEAGDLMSRLVNDTDTIGNLFSQSLVQSLGSIFSLIALLIAMLLLNVQLALVTILILPVMIVATFYFSARSRVAFRETRQTLGNLSADIESSLSMVRESQSFARTALDIAEFQEDNAANRDANIYASSITSAFAPTIDVLSTLATVLVAGYGGFLAFNGSVTVGTVVAFLTYAQQFFRPVQQISQLYTQMQAAFAASERVFELFDTPPEIVDRDTAVSLPDVVGDVQFNDIAFGYVPSTMILDGFSLNVKAGQTVALVGETGAGKSTVVNLIGRFYDVHRGSVNIDGHDVRDVQVHSLREQLGEVPQSSFLFADTIGNNIKYGRPDASDEEMVDAAKAARAHEFISALPEGYDTPLSASGKSVSQGQRQLLCIARAILADPRLLIFDEATANIDTRTEQLVQEAIDELLEGRTAFVIAHRLSTIRHADNIVVIGDRGIVEQGSHDVLMAADGAYANLINQQQNK